MGLPIPSRSASTHSTRQMLQAHPTADTERCYCQPKPNVETSRPVGRLGETMIREMREEEPGWPERIGSEGYAQHLLGISNHGGRRRGGAGEMFVDGNDEPLREGAPTNEDGYETDDEASAHASLYVHTGGGSYATTRNWKGRNTGTISEDDVKAFARPPSPLEEERRLSKSSSSSEPEIEIVEEGVVEETIGKVCGDGSMEEGDREGERRKDEGLVERREGRKRGWRRVVGFLGCGARL